MGVDLDLKLAVVHIQVIDVRLSENHEQVALFRIRVPGLAYRFIDVDEVDLPVSIGQLARLSRWASIRAISRMTRYPRRGWASMISFKVALSRTI